MIVYVPPPVSWYLIVAIPLIVLAFLTGYLHRGIGSN